jgi:hypothetical protein
VYRVVTSQYVMFVSAGPSKRAGYLPACLPACLTCVAASAKLTIEPHGE